MGGVVTADRKNSTSGVQTEIRCCSAVLAISRDAGTPPKSRIGISALILPLRCAREALGRRLGGGPDCRGEEDGGSSAGGRRASGSWEGLIGWVEMKLLVLRTGVSQRCDLTDGRRNNACVKTVGDETSMLNSAKTPGQRHSPNQQPPCTVTFNTKPRHACETSVAIHSHPLPWLKPWLGNYTIPTENVSILISTRSMPFGQSRFQGGSAGQVDIGGAGHTAVETSSVFTIMPPLTMTL